ncbi:hypothetical protein AVEN_227167-1, partial [Araneus ventricosus]
NSIPTIIVPQGSETPPTYTAASHPRTRGASQWERTFG